MCGGGELSFCYCILWLDARDNRCVYMAHVAFYVCCSDCVLCSGRF